MDTPTPTRSASRPRDEIVEIPFDALPQSDRDRLARCARGERPPKPLLVEELPVSVLAVGRAFLAALPAVALVLLALWGFGNPASSLGVQAGALAVVYCAAGALVAVAVYAVLHALAAPRAVPFPLGKYLFAWTYVDARTPTLRVVPLDNVNGAEVEARQSAVFAVVYFDGGITERVGAPSRGQAERAAGYLLARRDGEAWATQPPGPDEDLFAGAKAAGWPGGRAIDAAEFERAQRRVGLLPADSRGRLAAAALLGLAAGAGLFFGRNALSDERMFADARARDSSAAYRQYAENGVRHRDESVAAAADAERRETVAAAFEAFQKAKADRDPEAMRRVLARTPDVPFADDVRASIRDVYAEALAAYRERAPKADPQAAAFVTHLLDYLAGIEPLANPVVLVSFRYPTEAAREFVEGYSLRDFEEQFVTDLGADFGGVFRPEVMRLEPGSRYEGEASDAGTKLPVIEVAYDMRKVENAVYVNGTTGERSWPLHFTFDVTLRLPTDPASVKQRVAVVPPSRIVMRGYQTAYDATAENAFKELEAKLKAYILSA